MQCALQASSLHTVLTNCYLRSHFTRSRSRRSTNAYSLFGLRTDPIVAPLLFASLDDGFVVNCWRAVCRAVTMQIAKGLSVRNCPAVRIFCKQTTNVGLTAVRLRSQYIILWSFAHGLQKLDCYSWYQARSYTGRRAICPRAHVSPPACATRDLPPTVSTGPLT